MDLKPKESEWRGWRFRSRLELRWATYFTALGMDFEYEPEGFTLEDGTGYLPDFVIHNVRGIGRSVQDVYVEVKGEMSKTDYHKIELFSKTMPIYICMDVPYDGGDDWTAAMEKRAELWPYPFNFLTITGAKWPAFLGIDRYGNPKLFNPMSQDLDRYDQAMNMALQAAKGARFDHGERPDDQPAFKQAMKYVAARKRVTQRRYHYA